MKKITYIADIDADVDDLIAARYLKDKGVLGAVVLDPKPVSDTGFKRVEILKNLGIDVRDSIPEDTDTIFIGGALTIVAEFVKTHKLANLVMNGGFVGCNLVPEDHVLEKFTGKVSIRTFNFNCDVKAADYVLSSPNIDKIVLVGKNVCHHPKNTAEGIWKTFKPMIEGEYRVRPGKLQHDMLACREGLVALGYIDEPALCIYRKVYPFNHGLKGNMTQWGSTIYPEPDNTYREVLAAVDWVRFSYIPMQNAEEKTIVLTRNNFARHSEASLQACIEMHKYLKLHPEMDNLEHIKERRDMIWAKTVELFNDPNFKPDDPEQQQ
jgi:hypothetical protein